MLVVDVDVVDGGSVGGSGIECGSGARSVARHDGGGVGDSGGGGVGEVGGSGGGIYRQQVLGCPH